MFGKRERQSTLTPSMPTEIENRNIPPASEMERNIIIASLQRRLHSLSFTADDFEGTAEGIARIAGYAKTSEGKISKCIKDIDNDVTISSTNYKNPDITIVSKKMHQELRYNSVDNKPQFVMLTEFYEKISPDDPPESYITLEPSVNHVEFVHPQLIRAFVARIIPVLRNHGIR